MVADLEKVINGLERMVGVMYNTPIVVWFAITESDIQTLNDALELLKEKTVIPHRNYSKLSSFWCECGWYLGKPGDGSVTYCANCGRKVDWNGAV